MGNIDSIGARDGTRTRTPDYQAADFKSAASAIPPLWLFQQSTKSRPLWQCPAACFALDVGHLVMLSAVCLPTCGHGSGNGTPCAGRAICASVAPLGVYIYAVGGESCATRLPLLRSVPLRPEPWPRMAPLVEFVAQRRTSASLALASASGWSAHRADHRQAAVTPLPAPSHKSFIRPCPL